VDSPTPAWLPGVRLRFELYPLALGQLIEGGLLHGAGVEEYIFRSALGLNEAKPAIPDHALDDTYCHDTSLLAGGASLEETSSYPTGCSSLCGAATVGRVQRVQLEGALPGPSQRLGARHPPRLRLRYEVAPPLCLAQDAVSLKLLPETTQKMFLRFALAELYEQVVSFLIAG
jgi:hypothetical protein